MIERTTTWVMEKRGHKPNYYLPIIATILLSLGLIVVYAINPGASMQKGVSDNYFVIKQIVSVLLGLAAFIFTSRLHYDYWVKILKLLLFFCVISCILVQVIGMATHGGNINGSYRWIQLGSISFQPAELLKFTLLFWLAHFLSIKHQHSIIKNNKETLHPLLKVLLTIGVVVGGLQSDLGSTAVMVAMLVGMMFAVGVPMKNLVVVGIVVISSVLILVAITPYRRDRLTTFINPTKDCQADGYQACQARIAVGSGGLFGLGLGHSVQAYGYLPEATNDSIFAIIAEKFGFVGSSVVLILYLYLFFHIYTVMHNSPDVFSRLLVLGVLLWFGTQTIINIGAMVGLLPLKGITLPFISYGGTSLLFVTAALGVVFNISRYTTLQRRGSDRRGI